MCRQFAQVYQAMHISFKVLKFGPYPVFLRQHIYSIEQINAALLLSIYIYVVYLFSFRDIVQHILNCWANIDCSCYGVWHARSFR